MLALQNDPLLGVELGDVLRAGALGVRDRAVEPALIALAKASAELGRRVAQATLGDELGRAYRRNAFGDDVQKLDAEANQLFCTHLAQARACVAIASEELERPLFYEGRRSPCSVMLDPLDGSSNLNAGLSVGSIFGIFSGVAWPTLEHAFLRPGRELTVAGYVLYSSRTTLVLASRERVLGFELDPGGEFRLTSGALNCPTEGRIYSVNEANQTGWDKPMREWLGRRRVVAPNGESAQLRYSGTLVADAHRALVQGGVFAYPATRTHQHGKLRLLYEVNPMAFIFEAAGGASETSEGCPLDLVPRALDQRSPIVLGSLSDVEEYRRTLSRHPRAERPSVVPSSS